jgi:hypothetical protein
MTFMGISAYTVITFVIMIFTVIQFGSSQRFNKKQIGAMSGQLSVMRGQLKQMTDSTHLDMRAYVNLRQLVPEAMSDKSGELSGWELKPIFVNTGKTPAINVSIALVRPDNEVSFLRTPDLIAIEKNPTVAQAIPFDELPHVNLIEWKHSPQVIPILYLLGPMTKAASFLSTKHSWGPMILLAPQKESRI